ncbi:hypothetical protein MNBD_GAMMA22-3017 [hydrothermal vent metagenome]|uniref:Nitrogen regulatory protein P-II n=1 Tax=hydrothermal vent metagenome TaxID=652676 RepID=A0A3B0ZSB7_9ZZZZ
MNYRKITAIIPESSLKSVEDALLAEGVSGVTVSSAHGYGEYRNFYAKDNMNDCSRIEVFVEKGKTKKIVKAIASSVSHGLKSDGIIAILPVEEFIHIREFNKANAE